MARDFLVAEVPDGPACLVLRSVADLVRMADRLGVSPARRSQD